MHKACANILPTQVTVTCFTDGAAFEGGKGGELKAEGWVGVGGVHVKRVGEGRVTQT